MVLATQSAIAADAHLLDPGEQQQIEGLMTALAQARDGSDAAIIEAATKALAQATEAFAARRMNQGIAQALAGKNIQTL